MKKGITISLFSFLLLFSACSSSNYKILSFFFDGVPDPNEQKNKTEEVVIDSSGIKRREEILKKATPKFVLHGPYGAKLCKDCHNLSQGFKLIKKDPELCYGCHVQFKNIPKFIHGPVVTYCNGCHHPHRSKNKYLLLEAGNSLCYKCHNEIDFKKNKKHPEIEDKSCITCHDPHGNNVQYFLL